MNVRKEFERGTHKTFFRNQYSSSEIRRRHRVPSYPLIDWILQWRITLCGVAAHCFVYSFPHHLYSFIHLLSFLQSPEIHYFILVSKGISVKDYPSLSFPFTHALLLLYLICKDHLFFTFLCLFCSFLYFLLSFICFMPTSLHFFFLLPHYGLSFNASFLPFISLGIFSFLFITCWFPSGFKPFFLLFTAALFYLFYNK